MAGIRDGEEGVFTNLLLSETILMLPDKYRIVMLLRASGYTQKECGEIIGVTRAAIGFIQKKANDQARIIMEGKMR